MLSELTLKAAVINIEQNTSSEHINPQIFYFLFSKTKL